MVWFTPQMAATVRAEPAEARSPDLLSAPHVGAGPKHSGQPPVFAQVH